MAFDSNMQRTAFRSPVSARHAAGQAACCKPVTGHESPDVNMQPPAVASTHGFRRLRILFFSVIALSLTALGLGYVVFANKLSVRETAPLPSVDAIVAVTGGSNRIGDAIDLLQARHGRRLLISGVNEKTGREELARLNPAGRQMIACCIDLDYRARNTIGNAIATRRWARSNSFSSLMVVTSNYHLPRTMLEFQHAMPGVKLAGYPVVHDATPVDHWWQDATVARIIGTEYLKYLVAWARTKLEDDPETSRLSIIIGGRKPISPRGNEALRPQDSRFNGNTGAQATRS